MALKLGIIANEFFEPTIGRMGGFGWAARQFAKFSISNPGLIGSVVFLAAGLRSRSRANCARVHETRLIYYHHGPQGRALLRQEKFDLLLTIDYRPRYREILDVL